jgi:hypothetical protein
MTHKQMVEMFEKLNEQLFLIQEQMGLLHIRINLLELQDAHRVENPQDGF